MTGVQTCALPIWLCDRSWSMGIVTVPERFPSVPLCAQIVPCLCLYCALFVKTTRFAREGSLQPWFLLPKDVGQGQDNCLKPCNCRKTRRRPLLTQQLCREARGKPSSIDGCPSPPGMPLPSQGTPWKDLAAGTPPAFLVRRLPCPRFVRRRLPTGDQTPTRNHRPPLSTSLAHGAPCSTAV